MAVLSIEAWWSSLEGAAASIVAALMPLTALSPVAGGRLSRAA
jgi:hypothetical protein